MVKVEESNLRPWAWDVLVVTSSICSGRALTPYVVLLRADHLIKVFGWTDAIEVVFKAVLGLETFQDVGHASF